MEIENSAPKIIRKVLSDVKADKLNRQLVDEKYREMKSKQESRYLAKASRVLINLWDLAGIIMKAKPGESVVIDCDSGNISVGNAHSIKQEKLRALPVKVPGRTSLEFDTEGLHEHLVGKSFVYVPAPALKNAWEGQSTHEFKTPKNDTVWLFMDKLNTTPKDRLSTEYITNNEGQFVELAIKNYPVKLGISVKSNKVRYYIWQGKKHNV